MKRFLIALPFLLASPVAFAQQQPSVKQQIDSMTSDVTRTITMLGSAVLADQQTIAQLQEQIKTLTAANDDLKKKADTAAPHPVTPAPVPVPAKP